MRWAQGDAEPVPIAAVDLLDDGVEQVAFGLDIAGEDTKTRTRRTISDCSGTAGGFLAVAV
jgi:hypothetical protein